MSHPEPAMPTVYGATVVDFGRVTPDLEQALARFDELPPGLTLVLQAGSSLDGILGALRARRRGLFEWTPTLEGPWYWEVEVFRRYATGSVLRRVDEALDWDHERLEALQQRTFSLHARGRYEAALRLYARFAHGLRRHIRVEEDVVLPELERRLGLDPADGPTAGIRAEHRQILRLLAAVASHPGAASLRPDGPAAELRAILARHERGEERLIDAALGELLDPATSDALVAAMQDLPPTGDTPGPRSAAGQVVK